MKISELMGILQNYLEDSGDCGVWVLNPEDGSHRVVDTEFLQGIVLLQPGGYL